MKYWMLEYSHVNYISHTCQVCGGTSLQKKGASLQLVIIPHTVRRSSLTQCLRTLHFPCNNSGGVCQVTPRVTVYALPALLEALRWKPISICKRPTAGGGCPLQAVFSPPLRSLCTSLLIRLVKNGPNFTGYINK